MDPQDLAKMESLLKRQEQLGNEIETLVKNYKKTALERRTLHFHEKRLTQLIALRKKFEQNDDWLQELDAKHKTSNYFVNNYAVQIVNMAEEWARNFQMSITKMAPSLNELYQKQSLLIGEIEKTIDTDKATPVNEKTKLHFEKFIRKLEEVYSELESNNNIIKLLAGINPTHDYFTQNRFDLVSVKTRQAINSLKDGKVTAPDHPNQSSSATAFEQSTNGQVSNTVQSSSQNLIRRQNAMMSSLQRMLQASKPEDISAPSLKPMERLWEQIQDLHFSIWENSDDPTDIGYNMTLYMDLESQIMDSLASSATKFQIVTSTLPSVPLPKINIPKFNGDYDKWPTFYDLFTRIVHEQKISAVEKMWYLKTNLSGEAERLIRHLSLTDINYDAAWRILKERYSNKRILTATIIQQILDHPNVINEASSIKGFHDLMQENLAALDNLEIGTKHWDPLLLQILIKKIDRHTHNLYEQTIINPRELQTVEHFMTFLLQRFQSLESMGGKDNKKQEKSSAKDKGKVTSSVLTSSSCKVCNQKGHPIYYCEKFKNTMTPAERLNWVQKEGLCVNCFKPDHKAKTCKSRSCSKCNKKHNSLLHLERKESQQQTTKPSTTSNSALATSAAASVPAFNEHPSNTTSPVVVTAASSTNNPSKGIQNYVILATAKIRIVANNGQTCEARAVLDSGSQVNLVTQRLINKLSVTTTKSELSIEGVGLKTGNSRSRINVSLESLVGKYSTRFEAFVLPNIISAQPSRDLNINDWKMPQDIELADPEFFKPEKIDVLIGAEFYHSLLYPEQIPLGNKTTLLQNTSLGWIVIGKTEIKSSVTATCAVFSHEEEDERISEILERFWRLENFGEDQTIMTKEEKACETHFANTVSKNEQGRFIVRLPFSDDPNTLGDSRYHAEKRLESLERRLAKQPIIKEQYIKFMDEYEALGHMERIQKQNIPINNYFIPHHCVLKPDSTTTKLRVVFDASAKTSNGKALNDILQKGPTVQSELVSILLRFRTHRFVFTADIEKMYRQIQVHDDDTAHQLIVWRKDIEEDFQYYRLKTVTYGTTSAPYLATKCLQHLATQNIDRYPLGAETIRDDFYVDDCLSGANTISTAKEIQKQVTTLLQNAGFKLRKWCANHSQLLAGIPPEDQEINLDLNNGSPPTIKTLGLIWRPKSDELCGRAHMPLTNKVTKRSVSSDLARIFDPLGIFGPVTVKAKIFMQQLWEQKLTWDEDLPTKLTQQWTQFRINLAELNHIKTYRHIFNENVPLNIQIHTFVDASEHAYGAAVYIRATYKDKTITTRLLCSKSKVAPMKRLTIPRLELSAAVIGATLTHRVKLDLKYADVPTFFWTDSEIVLSWIQSPSSTLHTFVANRISRITQISNAAQWHHVGTKDNPADILSRGVNPDKLASFSPWFQGPFFLYGSNEWWQTPEKEVAEAPNDIERRTKSVVAVSKQWSPLEATIYNINHKNSFRFLLHTVGYLLRPFIRPKPNNVSLSPSELRSALIKIIKTIQMSEFQEEIKDLQKHKAVGSSSSLRTLAPFIDNDGVLRVGGRLNSASLPYDAKHPMLLPYNEVISKLILEMEHKENKHCGPQALLSIIRQRFWPIKGKIMARSIVHNCIQCSKAKPKLFGQLMGNLPEDRITQSRPFLNTGVDYAGPFWISYKIRGKKKTKAYLAVFCCFATKAVHFELVSDLTTNAFIGALKRFTSRRGRCQNLYCDNATNFIGAKNQLEELRDAIYSEKAKDTIMRYTSDQGINFKFIPPRAPHFGGLWEAAVKSAKHLLVRSVSTVSLTYEELETVFVEAEAILNSRPLTPLSTNPNDLAALTPGHFLIGEHLATTPNSYPDAQHESIGLLTRWKLVSQLKYDFWKRWSKEYLNELQQRSKWNQKSSNLQEGMMVIIKDDNLPIMKWPIGRILKTIMGKDGLVRVAEIKTATGIYKRPIHLLAPLPTESAISAQKDPEPAPNTTPSLIVSIPLDRLRKADFPPSETIPKKVSRLERSEPSASTSETTTKGASYIHPNLFLTLLAFLLLPIALCSPVVQHGFPNKPGLYFEGIGTVNRVTADWKIITYYDLTPIRREIEIFRNGTTALQDLCSLVTQQDMCHELVQKFNNINLELETDDKITKRRKRRGALDIVGNIANKLFGVLDSEYAENLSKTIHQLNANDDMLLRLIKNQTSVVDSTINILTKETEVIAIKLTNFQQEINNISAQVIDLVQHIDVLEIYTALSTQLSLMATKLQKIEAAIFDALTDARHGKINPLLISPSQIETEITKIKSHLPNSLHLPFDEDDIIHLYSVMTSKSGISAHHVVFILTLPLTSSEQFDLFQITPIPAVINNTMVSIRPETIFIAVTPHRDQYFALSYEELQACTHATQTTGQLLCSDKPLKYQQGAEAFLCEYNMLRTKQDDNCTFYETKSEVTWSPLHQPNQWIFASKQRTQITMVCNGHTNMLELQGSHLLKLQDDCTLKHNVVTLQAHKTFSDTIYESHAMFGNVGTINRSKTRLIVHGSPLDLSDELEQLKHLHQAINQTSIIELPSRIWRDNIHQYATSYSALLLIISTILWIIWKLRQMKQNDVEQTTAAPTAQPRFTANQNTPIVSSRFTVDSEVAV